MVRKPWREAEGGPFQYRSRDQAVGRSVYITSGKSCSATARSGASRQNRWSSRATRLPAVATRTTSKKVATVSMCGIGCDRFAKTGRQGFASRPTSCQPSGRTLEHNLNAVNPRSEAPCFGVQTAGPGCCSCRAATAILLLAGRIRGPLPRASSGFSAGASALFLPAALLWQAAR